MCFIKARILVFAFGSSLRVLTAFAQQALPDFILFDGKVFTSSASHPYVDALGEPPAQRCRPDHVPPYAKALFRNFR